LRPGRGWRVRWPLAADLLAPLLLALALTPASASTESRSVGSPARGRLEGGVAMPTSGTGFVTYSRVGHALGRQHVHSRVRDALVAAFAARSRSEPGRVFVLGETGWRRGGRMRPHRTHQNGLSVDIFVPVSDAQGRPRSLPSSVSNRFGYDLELDRRGRLGALSVDFQGLAALLSEIERQAVRHGLTVQKVIVAPEYVPLILATPAGAKLGRLGDALSRRPAWVRHDEHIHIDFAVVGAPTRAPASGH
jgi:penicillin-insensitive murein endopeptidase